MTTTTEEAERLARGCDIDGFTERAAALRSLVAERDALKAENEVMQAALRRINSSITPPGEIALKAENARLREALQEIEYLDRPQVRGMPRRKNIQEIARAALGEK